MPSSEFCPTCGHGKHETKTEEVGSFGRLAAVGNTCFGCMTCRAVHLPYITPSAFAPD